ncbi:hypothetical protein KDA08_05790, partial [Candidatus Saccharibacteria bacterium]|nr:hypothetical protein [Candidatus Saccharibacteria bacterium]
MTDLLARISARHRNHITSAQILFSEIAGIMAKVREWHEQVDHMSGQQLVAMLFIIQKMQSDLNEI